MAILRNALGVLSLLTGASTCAQVIEVPIPDVHWKVTFVAPSLIPTHQYVAPELVGSLRYRGIDGRLNVFLFVGPPECPNGDSTDAVRRCLEDQIEGEYGLDRDSQHAEVTAKRVELVYQTKRNVGGRDATIVNRHVAFVHKGKWVHLRINFLEPEVQDLWNLRGIAGSVQVVE